MTHVTTYPLVVNDNIYQTLVTIGTTRVLFFRFYIGVIFFKKFTCSIRISMAY